MVDDISLTIAGFYFSALVVVHIGKRGMGDLREIQRNALDHLAAESVGTEVADFVIAVINKRRGEARLFSNPRSKNHALRWLSIVVFVVSCVATFRPWAADALDDTFLTHDVVLATLIIFVVIAGIVLYFECLYFVDFRRFKVDYPRGQARPVIARKGPDRTPE